MPDVLVIAKENVNFPDSFVRGLRLKTAVMLTCNECKVEAGQVDVRIIPIVDGDAHRVDVSRLHSNADVLIEVAGYGYPSRMSNIESRITAIAAGVKKMIGEKHRVCDRPRRLLGRRLSRPTVL